MTSIIWLAIGIVIASALLGSLVLGFLTPQVSSVITLQEKCEKLDIEAYQVVLFSKRGFSKELKQMQGKNLALYSAEDFEALLKNASNTKLIENLFKLDI